MLEHARELDDSLELQLAPAASYGGLAHRVGEARGRFVNQRQLGFGELAQLLVQAEYASMRVRSISPSLPSTFVSDSLIGCTSWSTACCLALRSLCARSWN